MDHEKFINEHEAQNALAQDHPVKLSKKKQEKLNEMNARIEELLTSNDLSKSPGKRKELSRLGSAAARLKWTGRL
jgi:hypothetical protein